MRTLLFTVCFSLLTPSCSRELDPNLLSTVVQDTRAARSNQPENDSAKAQFRSQLIGFWHALVYQQSPDGTGAWVDLYWVIAPSYGWHVVTLYADGALRIPLLRWDLVRGYDLEEPSDVFPESYNLEWTDIGSWLTAYVDHPDLFASIRVDDCALDTGIRVDTTDNCGAPFFPFRDCPLKDFARVQNGRLTFGDPQSTDRCVERANQYEAWTFEKVPLSQELLDTLFGAP